MGEKWTRLVGVGTSFPPAVDAPVHATEADSVSQLFYCDTLFKLKAVAVGSRFSFFAYSTDAGLSKIR